MADSCKDGVINSLRAGVELRVCDMFISIHHNSTASKQRAVTETDGTSVPDFRMVP
jgi:hypothetical protein